MTVFLMLTFMLSERFDALGTEMDSGRTIDVQDRGCKTHCEPSPKTMQFPDDVTAEPAIERLYSPPHIIEES